MTIVALGTAPPLGSSTSPTTEPYSTCALAGCKESPARTSATRQSSYDFICLPPCRNIRLRIAHQVKRDNGNCRPTRGFLFRLGPGGGHVQHSVPFGGAGRLLHAF